MNITIQVDQLNDTGPNFQLFADVGSVSPQLVTNYQLLNGVQVTVDDSASKIVIRSLGECASSVIVSIANANC